MAMVKLLPSVALLCAVGLLVVVGSAQQCPSGRKCATNNDCASACPCMPGWMESYIKESLSNSSTAAAALPVPANDQHTGSGGGGGKCGLYGTWCGSLCRHTDDCPGEQGGSSECTACVNGRCHQPICGSKCQFSSDCPSSCPECNGRCQAAGKHNRTCGLACTHRDQCSQNDGCSECRDGVCNIPPDPVCGASCSKTDDCQANNTVCNYCTAGNGCNVYMDELDGPALSPADRAHFRKQAQDQLKQFPELVRLQRKSRLAAHRSQKDRHCGAVMADCSANPLCSFQLPIQSTDPSAKGSAVPVYRCVPFSDWIAARLAQLFGSL